MGDPERAAVARSKVESQELLRNHRRLTARLELVERALERCTEAAIGPSPTNPDRAAPAGIPPRDSPRPVAAGAAPLPQRSPEA